MEAWRDNLAGRILCRMLKLSSRVLGVALGGAFWFACSSSQDTASTGTGGSAGTGGSGNTAGVVTGGTGWASGGSAGAGGSVSLACDPGFSFSPDPPVTGSVLTVKVTNASPLTYVELKAGGASASLSGISTNNPWTWDFEVVGLFPGVQSFEFWAGQPSAKVASCEKLVGDTGAPPDAGSGGTGGSSGSGGTGGQCCKLVGTKLAHASPCGPSQSASPWQTLDNAGCNQNGCQKIWCPFEKCDSAKYPNGCPQGTEACWIDNSFSTYEDACKSCCESYGACWDSAIGTCRHPGDCGQPIWKCPWQP
jgi:hypothetical protein